MEQYPSFVLGLLGSDADMAWFCGPGPLCPLLRDLVSDARCCEVAAVVLGSPWVVLLILCSPLGCGFGFGMGLIVFLSAGGWGLVQISCGVVVFVLGAPSSAGSGSSDHSVHLAL